MKNSKQKQERTKRGTLRFINIKILPNNGISDYINLLTLLAKKDYRVKVRMDRFMLFTGLTRELDGKVYKGSLIEYTSLDPDGFIDLNTRENIQNPYEDFNLGANQKRSYFYFIPEAHRIVLLKNSEININSVIKYLEEAVKRLYVEESIKKQEFFIYLIKSDDLIEVLENAYLVTYIKATLSYSNKDNSKGFDKFFDKKINESGANQVNFELKTERGNSLSMEEDSLPKAIVELSKNNGDIEARVVQKAGDPVTKVNTQQYPLEEPVKFTDSSFLSVVYEKVMSIWRNDE
jgi:hypothetical protein